ncbi:MAG TPA: MaoC family dehydratase [Novosphingobium sp.]|nr:MaoC family dehydratase [Novosphingobium sp.]
MRFYEDLVVGEAEHFGQHAVLREEVIAFARQFDPQPFHLSDEAAAQTHFGRLAASGWHTCGMTMAMLVAHFQETGHQGLGGAGIENLAWLQPVYPGDTLSVEVVVTEKRRSRSRPEMGIIRQQTTTFNQHGEPVLRYTATGMIATRDPAGQD